MIHVAVSRGRIQACEGSGLLYITNPETGKTEGQDPGAEPLALRRGEQGRQGRTNRERQAEKYKPAA